MAPWVVAGTAAFEAAVALLLLRGGHEQVGLWSATAWVAGVSPAIAWPYWTVNVPQAALYAYLARQHRSAARR